MKSWDQASVLLSVRTVLVFSGQKNWKVDGADGCFWSQRADDYWLILEYKQNYIQHVSRENSDIKSSWLLVIGISTQNLQWSEGFVYCKVKSKTVKSDSLGYRAVGKSKNPGVPVLFSGHKLPPLVEIG